MQTIDISAKGDNPESIRKVFQQLKHKTELIVDAVPTLTWVEITAATQGAVRKGYIANNISRVTVTLPVTASVGDLIGICGKGAGGWKIAQNASQTIHFGTYATLTGTSGYMQSDNYLDDCQLVCITENTNWKVIWSCGNIVLNIS